MAHVRHVLWQGVGSAIGCPKAPSTNLLPCALHLQDQERFPGADAAIPAVVQGAVQDLQFSNTQNQVPVKTLSCSLLRVIEWLGLERPFFSSEEKLWLELLCCFGGLGYFSEEKEIDPLTQETGRWSNSDFLIFAFVASIRACCCWLQTPAQSWARARAGLTTLPMSPFPLLLLGTAAFLHCFMGIGDLHSLVREMLIPSMKLGVPGMCQLLHALG